MRALEAIAALERGRMEVLREERWLHHIALTREQRVNLERVRALGEITGNPVLAYTKRTLELLAALSLDPADHGVLEEALCWCEVAKAGMPHQRAGWLAQGFNLFAHNEGSAQIYRSETPAGEDRRELVAVLIETHGLLGQWVRGEVPLALSRPLWELVERGRIEASRLEQLLLALNRCIIAAVDPALWEAVRGRVEQGVARVAAGELEDARPLRYRLERLRGTAIARGEDFGAAWAACLTPALERQIDRLLRDAALWYVEAALSDFSLEEFVKIFLLLAVEAGSPRHISFEPLMRSLYRDHRGEKRVNLYKKRVVEQYLAALTPQAILAGERGESPHVAHEITRRQGLEDTVFFAFRFSPAGEKLTDFCVAAEEAGVLYEQAVLLLFDLFGLRRDQFDRFYNEDSYLETMNRSTDHKRVLLDHVAGNTVLDVGPGGGGLLDLMAEAFPHKRVLGIDLSRNVIDSLNRRRVREGRRWEVVYGDALDLEAVFAPGEVDTVVFCSVLHELFSYIEREGRRFHHGTVAAALRSAWAVLPTGGRLLIRDGIMTEPEEQLRTIRFRSAEGMAFLERYARDFQGRTIRFWRTGRNQVQMPVNDAMEFLYTYTWGEESYVHEVQEQFGYFTPGGYTAFLRETLGPGADILVCKHFLQEGYATALAPKIAFLDEQGEPVPLPDSTCILVVEKS